MRAIHNILTRTATSKRACNAAVVCTAAAADAAVHSPGPGGGGATGALHACTFGTTVKNLIWISFASWRCDIVSIFKYWQRSLQQCRVTSAFSGAAGFALVQAHAAKRGGLTERGSWVQVLLVVQQRAAVAVGQLAVQQSGQHAATAVVRRRDADASCISFAGFGWSAAPREPTSPRSRKQHCKQ
jgi:hypothetical protein